MSKTEPHKLSLSVQYAGQSLPMPTRSQLRRWVKVALQHDVLMTLRIVDEPEGHELNSNYRGKDYATNVLTFVYDDCNQPAQSGGNQMRCGDVVICAPVVEREAAEQGKQLLTHYAHLVIHATLHLQGYDHESKRDAVEMESLETALMLKLRMPDPYQEAQN